MTCAPLRSLAIVVAMGFAASAQQIEVSGEELAWRIETDHMVVNLAKNSGTGRSGQINTILLKDPSVLLTRERPASTLHLSPNAAVGRRWIGVNRWDPPSDHTLTREPAKVRLERDGEMPGTPGLHTRVVYEFFADKPAVLVEESIEANSDTQVRLLRVCEWSFAPGEGNPFTHLAWEDAAGRVVLREREPQQALPVDVRWVAFLSEAKRFSVAAIVDRLSVEEPAVQRNQGVFFSGDPHYFYWALILGAEGDLLTVPRGSRYVIRYWLYCYQFEEVTGATVPITNFRR